MSDTIPCEVCETPTNMLGTKRCHNCWEVERRLADYLKHPKGREHALQLLAPKLTDYPIIRHSDGGVPVYCVPIKLVKDNLSPLRRYKAGDAEVMAGYLEDGQKFPIFVKEDGTIIDGQRRVNGLRHLGCKYVDIVIVTVKDGLDALEALLNRTTTYAR